MLLVIAVALLTSACVAPGIRPAGHSGAAHGVMDTHRADSRSAALCPPPAPIRPHRGFRPLLASNASLVANGFPRRPPSSDKAAVQAWLRIIDHMRHWVPPHQVCSGVKHVIDYNGIWAGHVVPDSYVGNSAVFNFSEADWIQPGVNGDSNYTDYKSAPDASFWTGIGVSDLIQAGADSINTKLGTYKFWIEDYPAGTQWQDSPVVHAGNELFVFVNYLGNQATTWELDNITTKTYTSFSTSTPNVGTKAANFINERLEGFYLPDFDATEFTQNNFGNNSNFYGLTTNNDKWIMTSSCRQSGTILSLPGSVSSDTSFTVTWANGSPFNDNC
jgi:hypothetical protein